jgi:hypothetical protein
MAVSKTGLTAKQHKANERAEALGSAAVLAIGVDNYPPESGFEGLKTCVNDAHAMALAFKEVPQLLADDVRTLVAGASRGAMVTAIRELAKKNVRRLILFYSGHGWRVPTADGVTDFYFVPGDAPDDGADSLLSLSRVLELLEPSLAKTKIIILDACLSGPDTSHLKKPKEAMSTRLLNERLEKISGFVILSASAFNTTATTLSPDPTLSLFTHFVVKALRGDPTALDSNRMITHASLYSYVDHEIAKWGKTAQVSQTPGLLVKSNGNLPIGDFSGALVPDDAFDLNGNAADAVAFAETSGLPLKQVIPKLAGRKFSKEWLVGAASRELATFFADDIGTKKAALRQRFGWDPGAVSVNGSELHFPGGIYSRRCEDDGSANGCTLVSTVQFDHHWFRRAKQIPDVLETLSLRPDYFSVVLKVPVNPETMISGLQSRGWKTTIERPEKVEARHSSEFRITITRHELRFDGFAPSELFRNENPAEGALVQAVLNMVGAVPTATTTPNNVAVLNPKPSLRSLQAPSAPKMVVIEAVGQDPSEQAAIPEGVKKQKPLVKDDGDYGD